MTTFHIHIQGIVQGVGFRPFVYNLALSKELLGWVNNSTDGVHIEINADEDIAQAFLDSIIEYPPELAHITYFNIFKTKEKEFSKFEIIHSVSADENNVLLTPDFGLCPTCKKEIHDPDNKRFNYPFTTCINCGPRFSIINKLPYDRETTTMDHFEMCESCQKEYNDPKNRRYYSQTNSCPDCSIEISLLNSGGDLIDEGNNCLKDVVGFWKKGKIVAIKGIGGYLLTCDATNPEAIKLLRQRKNRPDKPFAVMYPNLKVLKKELKVNQVEQKELQGVNAPIVILDIIEQSNIIIDVDSVAPKLNCIGAMLPYTPLYELLLSDFAKPVIATSGNVSGSPIIFEDKQAEEELASIADYLFINNRDIVVPQDDSVIRYSAQQQQRIIIRRSRGLSPAYINPELKVPPLNIFAAGGGLKSTFSFTCFKNFYTSQYLGNLENMITQNSYSNVVDHFFEIFNSKPELVLADKHPLYYSRQFAVDLADKLSVPIHYFQHHKAHFAAVLGENNLLKSKESIIGIIWDGTGYGDDNNIWGGEFFEFKNEEINRIAHYEYFDHILGDKMAKEPRISALSIGLNAESAEEILNPMFTRLEWHIYGVLLGKENNLKTSSIGRLFDAVASLLGLIDVSSFEGQGGMFLEKCASSWYGKNKEAIHPVYFTPESNSTISINIEKIITDVISGEAKEKIAAQFHLSLVEMIRHVAQKSNNKNLAFSGGVFQNSLLIDLIIENLQDDFKLYFHKQLSPNDENISFGQVMLYEILNY
ncbi:MAG: carbamoyltransferase HypF [Bacteroidetes bacterium]|nr:MAG: carbamoyltransferase HypF [Bacteroidota bacterium]